MGIVRRTICHGAWGFLHFLTWYAQNARHWLHFAQAIAQFCVFCEQPWGMRWYLSPKTRFTFACYKSFASSSVFFSLNVAHSLWRHSFRPTCIISTGIKGHGSQSKPTETSGYCFVMSNKILFFWFRNLAFLASIYVTVTNWLISLLTG